MTTPESNNLQEEMEKYCNELYNTNKKLTTELQIAEHELSELKKQLKQKNERILQLEEDLFSNKR
jgi:predicted RNase H-like nuclease (RuvC/YqgF family)